MGPDLGAVAMSGGQLPRVAKIKLVASIADMENRFATSCAEVVALKRQLAMAKEERFAEFDVQLAESRGQIWALNSNRCGVAEQEK